MGLVRWLLHRWNNINPSVHEESVQFSAAEESSRFLSLDIDKGASLISYEGWRPMGSVWHPQGGCQPYLVTNLIWYQQAVYVPVLVPILGSTIQEFGLSALSCWFFKNLPTETNIYTDTGSDYSALLPILMIANNLVTFRNCVHHLSLAPGT